MDDSLWTITTEASERSLPPTECVKVIRTVATGEWGSVTVRRGGTEKLILRFDVALGVLEYWASDDGPVSGARFPNREPLADRPVELPCCWCGIPVKVPDSCVLCKADAVRLLLQFVASGVLPDELTEPGGAAQPVLPGMEEFVTSPADLNAVRWEPL